MKKTVTKIFKNIFILVLLNGIIFFYSSLRSEDKSINKNTEQVEQKIVQKNTDEGKQKIVQKDLKVVQKDEQKVSQGSHSQNSQSNAKVVINQNFQVKKNKNIKKDNSIKNDIENNKISVVKKEESVEPSKKVSIEPSIVITDHPKVVKFSQVRSNIKSSLKAVFSKEKVKNSYLAIDIGYVDYPTGRNLKGLGSLGLSLGLHAGGGLFLELGVFGSRLKIYDTFFSYTNGYSEMNQLNILTSIKYGVTVGKIQPYLGGTVTYAYRRHVDSGTKDFLSSGSIDVGFCGGVNFRFSPKVSAGLSSAYFINSYTTANKYYRSIDSSYKPLENFQYYTLNFNIKTLF